MLVNLVRVVGVVFIFLVSTTTNSITLALIMQVTKEINQYFSTLAEPKLSEMKQVHQLIIPLIKGGKLWFEAGKDQSDKTIHNPTIGYGHQTIKYANGNTKDFFQIGLSANTTGISIYILGIKDKTYLLQTFGPSLGKAKITGYCIRFKSIKDIDLAVLEAALQYGIANSEVR